MYVGSRLKRAWKSGRRHLKSLPSSRTGENPPYGMIGGVEETSASFEARSAPRSYPTGLSGALSPNRVGVVDGGKNQHGRAARGGVGGDGALLVGQAGGEGAHPRRAVRDDGLASQACGARTSATPD